MKFVLNKPTSGFNLAAINENFTRIEEEFQEKVLYRDNPVGEPNTLENDIDANSNNLYNVGVLSVTDAILLDGVDITEEINSRIDEAEAFALAAGVSAQEAEEDAASALASASAASASETNALSYANDAADSYALADSIADSLAGGTIGMDAPAYDWGSVADATTYFNRDFGSIA